MLSTMHPATYKAFRDELTKIAGVHAATLLKLAAAPPIFGGAKRALQAGEEGVFSLGKLLKRSGPPGPAPKRMPGMSPAGQALHASVPPRNVPKSVRPGGAGPGAGDVISGHSVAGGDPLAGMRLPDPAKTRAYLEANPLTGGGDNPLAGMILPDKARQMRAAAMQQMGLG